jgi:hypothetical protein
MKGLIYIFMLFCACKLQAQNLIYNGSFEEVSECYTTISDQVNGWYTPQVLGTPDVYLSNSDCPNEFGIAPFDGNNYCGIATGIAQTSINDPDAREYLTTKLLSPLESNSVYRLAFWIRKAQYAAWSSDKIGVYFSEDSIFNWSINQFEITPQIQTQEGEIFSGGEWIEIEEHYSATGGEHFLTFGCFVPSSELTLYYQYSPTGAGLAYYEFDNFSLVEIEGINVEERKSFVQLYPNPTSDVLHLQSSSDIEKIMVWSAEGALLIEEYKPSSIIDLSQLASGMYFVHIQNAQGQWQQEKIQVR